MFMDVAKILARRPGLHSNYPWRHNTSDKSPASFASQFHPSVFQGKFIKKFPQLVFLSYSYAVAAFKTKVAFIVRSVAAVARLEFPKRIALAAFGVKVAAFTRFAI